MEARTVAALTGADIAVFSCAEQIITPAAQRRAVVLRICFMVQGVFET
jgi:hypothetical protein